MTETFDCIVLGAGGFGSGALYHLARRGVRALGLERFGIAHDRGSSHGRTRIIRKAYFEHVDYVPLLFRAFDGWQQLEHETGKQLYHEVGLLIVGPAAGPAVSGALLAAQRHDLRVERLSAAEAHRRFPAFQIPDELTAVVEHEAGYLAVEDCVIAHLEQAQQRGAVLKTQETVLDWNSDGATVRVRTDKGEYEAPRAIFTAGPWTSQLLSELNLPLRVLRKLVFWHPVPAGTPTHPGFFVETPRGDFYGFPPADGLLKIGEHTGGAEVEDPTAVDRTLQPGDHPPVAEFLREFLPQAAPEPVDHSVCLYTITPDTHFIIDRHPEYPNVAFGAGFSGHGFKFTGVLGEALADLILDGRTDLPVDFLSLGRFAPQNS